MATTPVSPYNRRPMVRYSSPQRSTSPSLHNGLIFATTGQLYTGSRQHGIAPRDHEIINPARAPTNEPTPIFSAGKTFDRNVVALPVTRRPLDSPRRAERPSASDNAPATPTGRKHITPKATNGNVIAPPQSSTPERYRPQKVVVATHADNFIPGVSTSRVTDSPFRERPRGVKRLDGPPEFVPPAFEKRPYHPHLRQVEHKPQDNIFGSSIASPAAVVRDATPVRSGRRMTASPAGRSFNIITNGDV